MTKKTLSQVWDKVMAPYTHQLWDDVGEVTRKVYQEFYDEIVPKQPEHVRDPLDLHVGDFISVVRKDDVRTITWRGTIHKISVGNDDVFIWFKESQRMSMSFGGPSVKFLRHSKNPALHLKSLPIDTPVSISVCPGYNNEPPITVKGYIATETNPHTEETSIVIITTQSVRGSNVVSTKNVLDYEVLTQAKDTHNV